VIDSYGFSHRIAAASRIKRSRIILALDLTDGSDLNEFALKTISLLEKYICAAKLNFHLLLPLSSSEISEVNRHVHSYGLQSVADIKLNDVPSTNKVAISLLSSMGFDAITVNPFIGTAGLRATVVQAHELKLGILALVYMSNIGAKQGFGINFIDSNSQVTLLYQKFLQDAITCRADGVIVGGNRLEILREISCKKDRIPLYSPGIGVQGGNIKQAATNGTDYFIIGRSIIESKDPLKTAKNIQQQLAHVNVDS
jgi:orotidine-5'-phosphate decarboxylase